MSCGPRVGPTPNMSMTTGYSGSWEDRDCISCLSAASAAEVALSWDTACSTSSFVVSDFGMTPMCPLASAWIVCAFASLKLYPYFLHHRWYLFANAFRGRSETHSQCQNSATKSTHFSLPSARAGLTNRRFAFGKVISSKEIRLFFNTVCTLEYCRYWR